MRTYKWQEDELDHAVMDLICLCVIAIVIVGPVIYWSLK